MDVRSTIRLMRRNWALILIVVLLGSLSGAFVASLTPRSYSATTELFLAPTGLQHAGEAAQGGNYSQQQARNFSVLATRSVVLGAVIDDLALDVSEPQLRQQVSASVPLNSSIISVTVSDTSPERAADIANSMASNLVEAVATLVPELAGGSAPVSLQVVEWASVPNSPSAPSMPLHLALGTMLGVVAAAVVVAVRGLFHAKITTEEDVSNILRVPVLASVSTDRNTQKVPVAAVQAPGSRRAEEYRHLRTRVRFLQPGSAQGILVVSSSIPGEGKSHTAANLAATMAAAGSKVCLLEADFRRPSLSQVLGLEGTIGLTNVLIGEVDVADVVQPWGQDGLDVILAGAIPPNPSELLELPSTVTMLHELSEKYDAVVVDSPPLNPVTDAAVLARNFGGVLLVVRAKLVRGAELRKARQLLDGVGAPLLGAVLNGAAPSRDRYGDYYGEPAPTTRAARPSR